MSGWCHAASARWPTALITIRVPFQLWVRYLRRIHPPSRYQCGKSRDSRDLISSSEYVRSLVVVIASALDSSWLTVVLFLVLQSSPLFHFDKRGSENALTGVFARVAKRVTVTAPARLHLGFLDLNGGTGRAFGSIGLAISGFKTRVSVAPAQHMRVSGPESDGVRAYVDA